MCKRHGFDFSYVTDKYGISQNTNDTFRGDKFAILYDPGKFPAILQSSTGYFLRNGGVPQEGNLAEHMEVLEKHINELITDVDFDGEWVVHVAGDLLVTEYLLGTGVAVIDFESWRPVFRQNFGSLQPYKDLSFKIERQKHPFFSNAQIQAEAAKRFQKAGRLYVEDTIMLAKKMRPKAQWGYYAFPYCFNGNANNPESCSDAVKKENDGLVSTMARDPWLNWSFL
jgi:hyaluronoglucosaminidase